MGRSARWACALFSAVALLGACAGRSHSGSSTSTTPVEPLTLAKLCSVGVMVFADEVIAGFPGDRSLNDANIGALKQYGYQSPQYRVFENDVVSRVGLIYQEGATAARVAIERAVTADCGAQFPAGDSGSPLPSTSQGVSPPTSAVCDNETDCLIQQYLTNPTATSWDRTCAQIRISVGDCDALPPRPSG